MSFHSYELKNIFMWEDSRMHRTVFNCRQKQYSTFKREIVMGRVVRKHIDTRNSNFAAFYQNSQITTEIASSLIASFPTPSQCSRFVHSIIFPHITHTPVIWCDEFGALMVTGQARSTFKTLIHKLLYQPKMCIFGENSPFSF